MSPIKRSLLLFVLSGAVAAQAAITENAKNPHVRELLDQYGKIARIEDPNFRLMVALGVASTMDRTFRFPKSD